MLGPIASHAEIQFIVPYGAGGASDRIARSIAELAQPILNEDITVVNRPGAGGNIGLTEVLQSKPDGKTLGVLGTGFLFDPFKKDSDVPWKGPDDFDWVGIVMQTPYALYVKGDAPWKTVKELVDTQKTTRAKSATAWSATTGPACSAI